MGLTLIIHFMLKIIICESIYRNVAVKNSTTHDQYINPKAVLDGNLQTHYNFYTWFAVEMTMNAKTSGVIMLFETDDYGSEILVKLSAAKPSRTTLNNKKVCGSLKIAKTLKFQYLKCENSPIDFHKYVIFEKDPSTSIKIFEVKIIADVAISELNLAPNKPIFTNIPMQLATVNDITTKHTVFLNNTRVIIDLGETYQLHRIKIEMDIIAGIFLVVKFSAKVGRNFDYFDKNVDKFNGKPCGSFSTQLNQKTNFHTFECNYTPGRFVSIDAHLMNLPSNSLKHFNTFKFHSVKAYGFFYEKDYVGCFGSVVQKAFYIVISLEQCIMMCRAQNAVFAAIRNKTNCVCVDHLKTQPEIISACNVFCLFEIPCGSQKKYSVYHTKFSNETGSIEVACFLSNEQLFKWWAEEIQEFTTPVNIQDCKSYCYLTGYPYYAARMHSHGMTCICTSTYPLEKSIERSNCLATCSTPFCSQNERVLFYKTCSRREPYVDTCAVLDTYHCTKTNPQIDRFCGDFCYPGFMGMLCDQRVCSFSGGGCMSDEICKDLKAGLYFLSTCLPKEVQNQAIPEKLSNKDDFETPVESKRTTDRFFYKAKTTEEQFVTCPEGYKMNHLNLCEDLNECQFDFICGDTRSCVNTDGSYNCIYSLDAPFVSNTQKIVIAVATIFAIIFMIKLLGTFITFLRTLS